MDNEQIKQLLRDFLQEEGSEGLAKRIGVTRQHMWAVLVGISNPGPRLLAGMGLQAEVSITPVRAAKTHPRHIRPAKQPIVLGKLMRPVGPKTIQPQMTAAYRKLYMRAGQRAQQIVCRAVKDGKLPNLRTTPTVCVDCKERPAKQYEHRDYAKPLEVAPVCNRCNLRRGPAIISGPISNNKNVKGSRYKYKPRRKKCAA